MSIFLPEYLTLTNNLIKVMTKLYQIKVQKLNYKFEDDSRTNIIILKKIASFCIKVQFF